MSLDLKSISQEFQRYRGNRQRCKYPKVLWDKAVNLCEKYTVTKIIESLQVSRQSLFRHLKKPVESSREQFIPIEISPHSRAQLHIQSSHPISIDFQGSGKG